MHWLKETTSEAWDMYSRDLIMTETARGHVVQSVLKDLVAEVDMLRREMLELNEKPSRSVEEKGDFALVPIEDWRKVQGVLAGASAHVEGGSFVLSMVCLSCDAIGYEGEPGFKALKHKSDCIAIKHGRKSK